MADYEYWRTALAKPELLKSRQLRITTDPCLGFYRTKDGKSVAIFYDDDGVMVVLFDGAELHPRNYADVWLACAQRPVTEEWFRAHEETGRWPDVDEALPGDNVRAGMDEVEQIDMLADQVRKYGQIEDDEQAARATTLRARLMELKGVVDKKREELKAPHLKASREVDEVWMPPVKKATAAANALNALVSAWETLKRRRLREAEEAQERARREAEAANAPPPEPAPVTLPEPKSQIKGGYGRAAAVKEKRVVTGIADVLEAFGAVGHREEVMRAMIKEAQKAVDAGHENIPGFTIEMQAFLR